MGSPSIDMDNHNAANNNTLRISKSIFNPNHHSSSNSFSGDLKQENQFMSNSAIDSKAHLMDAHVNNALFHMDQFGDILNTTSNDATSANQMHDFLMMDLAQHTATNSAHINMTSPLLDFQGNNIQIAPSLNALTNGLFDLSNPTTPHLPPLNIDTANSQSLLGAMNVSPTMPPMPIVDVIGNNIPPPTDGLDWHTICTLNSLMGQQQQIETHSSNQNYRKRKKMTLSHTNPNQLLLDVDSKSNIESMSPSKRRKLNNHKTTKTENGNQHQSIISRIPKKRKRGRPRKNPEIVHSNGIKREKNVKKEKKEKRKRKKRTDDEYEDDDDDSNDDYHYLHSQYGADSYVGIRTEDGEVRIQIPRGKNKDTQCAKVKFSVFGNACSDKIEDILQPKKENALCSRTERRGKENSKTRTKSKC